MATEQSNNISSRLARYAIVSQYLMNGADRLRIKKKDYVGENDAQMKLLWRCYTD